MTVAAPVTLELVTAIDTPCQRFLYEHGGRYFVVVWSPWLDGYTAYRSTSTGEDAGVPLVQGAGRPRAEVLDRLEQLLDRGEL